MPMLDVFNNDAFNTVSLTDGILKAPHKPGRIGEMGLFRSRGITTTTVVVEEKDGRLSLIATTPRGGPGSAHTRTKRTARSFVVPHLERDSTVNADEVQGVRAFGSENALESVQAIVNERLTDMRAEHEVTLEHLRIGAVKGIIYDSDGSTPIFNLFTEFAVTQQTKEIDLSGSTLPVRQDCIAIQRLIEAELGAEPIVGYHAFAGDDFFDNLIEHASVTDTLKYQEGKTLREDLRKGFVFGGITWENYRGSVGGVNFVDPDEAFVFPLGTSIFQTYFAPADFIETVNTVGLPVYAKQAPDPSGLNRYVTMHSQSNPLALCLRPRAVVKCTVNT
jgi:hypothetical protein